MTNHRQHRPLQKPVFLCGMMGSGKSTVGRLLAGLLEQPFTDLDDEIEARRKMSIPDIFRLEGEPAFRRAERDVLMKLAGSRGGVIALGGGALQDQQIVNRLKQRGWLVFLDVPRSVLSERLNRDSGRPLLGGSGGREVREKIDRLLDERLRFYSQSHITVDTGTDDPATIAETIVDKLKAHES